MRPLTLVLLVAALCACHPLSLYNPRPLPASVDTRGAVTGNVEVLIDARGIPHVYGGTEADLAYGLGFMHGRDRLFQITLTTHAAHGRLSELFGSDLIDADRRLRLISWKLDEQLASLEPRDRRLLDAYVAGVNAGGASAGRTSELALLGLDVPTFTAADSLAIARLQAWQLAGDFEEELARDAVLAALPAGDVRRPYFDLAVPADGVPIVASAPAPPPRASRPTDKPSLVAGPSAAPQPFSPDAQAVLQRLGLASHGASNSWVVSGAKTASGKPVLCNDPHLDHTLPSVFYLAHLEGPDFTAAGATFPGLPQVLIGFTRWAAWGMTTSYADTQDLLRVRRAPGREDAYVFGDEVLPFETVTQTFRLGRGAAAKVITETWRGTRFGPMLPPAYVEGAPRAKDYALSWAVFDASPGNAGLVTSFFDLARAHTLADAESALGRANASGQNVTLAFSDGTIAYRLSAYVAAHGEGETGRLPRDADGSRPQRFLEVSERPGVTDPPSGFIVTANQRVIDDGDPRVSAVGTFAASAARATRIHERLSALLAQKKPTADELLRVQADVLSTEARENAPVLAAACPDAVEGHPEERVRAFCRALRHFDGSFRETSLGALPYTVLQRALRGEVAHALIAHDASLRGLLRSTDALANAVQRGLREGPASPLFNGDLRAFLKPAVAHALTALVSELGESPLGWRYGRVHTLTFKGPLADVPVLGGFYATDTFEQSGAGGAIHAEAGLPVGGGSVLRMVVELTSPPTARLTIDTGQSGTPRSPHAMDQFPAWNAFDPPPFPTARADVEAQTEARLTLLGGAAASGKTGK